MTEVTCAIIINEGKILITQRGEDMPHSLKWEFPGGKVMIGETPEKAVKREIQEELDIRISVDQLFPSITHHYNNHSIKLIPFICSIINGEISLAEHRRYKWIEFTDLKSVNWLEADARIVENLLVMYKIPSDRKGPGEINPVC